MSTVLVLVGLALVHRLLEQVAVVACEVGQGCKILHVVVSQLLTIFDDWAGYVVPSKRRDLRMDVSLDTG